MTGKNLGQVQSLVLRLGSTSSPCGVSKPSPDGPRKHQDRYRWPLAPRPPQVRPPTPNGLAIPGIRPQLPARFLHLDHESPTDACLGRHPALDRSPASPQRPRCAGVGATRVTFWKSSSLKPCVRSPQHTGWHPLPFPLRSHRSLGFGPLPTVATRRHTPSV